MPRAGPKKTQRYSLEFKRTAVQLSQRPSIQVQVVAEALDIHPFMPPRWRKEFREGRLKPSRPAPKPRASKAPLVRELRRLQSLGGFLRVAATPGESASAAGSAPAHRDGGDPRPEPRDVR